jgi:hypothetical protein
MISRRPKQDDLLEQYKKLVNEMELRGLMKDNKLINPSSQNKDEKVKVIHIHCNCNSLNEADYDAILYDKVFILDNDFIKELTSLFKQKTYNLNDVLDKILSRKWDSSFNNLSIIDSLSDEHIQYNDIIFNPSSNEIDITIIFNMYNNVKGFINIQEISKKQYDSHIQTYVYTKGMYR